jgi:uncharacterized MAPEG superfamily protein
VTSELKFLVLSAGLGFVHIVAASHSASLQRGYRWSSGPRDEPREPLHGVAGRLDRALNNFLETFPLFATVVLAAHVAGLHNALTEWGAQLYFWARVAYLPLYAAGVPLARSLVWNVAAVGILLFLVALLRH